MFTKILAPIQDVTSDQKVFETALDLAKQNEAGLMLLHVFSPEMKSTPALPNPVLYRYPMVTDELMKNYQQRWEETENRGLEMLKELARKAKDIGVTAEFSQNIGSIRNVICHMADNWNADLIVIRQPDRSQLSELLSGGTSNYVLHHAPCPVLAVPSS